MTDIYTLKFTLDTDTSLDLIEGTLKFYRNGELFNEYRATSSVAGKQANGAWKKRGGLIPPSTEIAKEYLVDVKPIYMPKVKGVEGNFYVISPYSVPTEGGVTRGDFGIHFDANVPGSLGCVVLRTRRGWEAFQRDIAATGLKQVPLVVEYI
jgi:hypothetical protein